MSSSRQQSAVSVQNLHFGYDQKPLFQGRELLELSLRWLREDRHGQ